MKLRDTEQVIHVQPGRKQGLFGSRPGELYITNQRVAFVSGEKLVVELDRIRVRAEKVPHKQSFVLVLTSGDTTARIAMEPQAIDQVVALLAPDEDAPSVNHYKS